MTTLAVVTATLDYPRAKPCIKSWWEHAADGMPIYIVGQGGFPAGWKELAPQLTVFGSEEILGVVPAFAIGVERALKDGAGIIACFHDDLEITEQGWDEIVVNLFKACPRAGLCGFGGAKGLGRDDLYQTPYDPMQLARIGFRSNMRDAEAHGVRSQVAEPVACLDGFSQIGLREFWKGVPYNLEQGDDPSMTHQFGNLFALLQEWGVVHHFYDGMLGCFAKRLRYQVWYLPIACHHHGGRTAVGDPRYQQWANTHRATFVDMPAGVYQPGQTFTTDAGTPHIVEGDQLFWHQAHKIGYDHFRDVLPLRT